MNAVRFTSTPPHSTMSPIMLAAPLHATIMVSKRATTERFTRSRCVVRRPPLLPRLPHVGPTGAVHAPHNHAWCRLRI
jgi:hypothetical protein